MTIRTLALGLLALIAFALPATAAADVTPIGHAVPSNDDFAVDGTDIYWLEPIVRRDRAKHRNIYESQLIRGSLLNNSEVKLATLDSNRDEIPEGMLGGGGAVYINLSNLNTVSDAGFDVSVKVIRISRDGERRTVAEVGSKERGDLIREGKKWVLDDCSKSVTATSISYAGDVVISQRSSERNSRGCGRKKNVDHWRYYEVSTSGLTREITTENRRVTYELKTRNGKLLGGSWGPTSLPLAEPWVYYGKAVYQRVREGDFFVKDLATGVTTGPFPTRIPGRDFYASAQLNSSGQLATFAGSSIREGGREKFSNRAGVFRTPGDPGSFAETKGDANLEFCGDHLISINNRGARELDPATFALKRVIAPGKDIAGDYVLIEPGCTDRFLYFTRVGDSKSVLLAYPLD